MQVPQWMRRGSQGRYLRRLRLRRLRSAVRSRTVAIVIAAATAIAVATVELLAPWGGGSDVQSETPDVTRDLTEVDAGPLTVAVEQVTWSGSCWSTWLVPRSPDEIDFTDDVDPESADGLELDWSEHSAGRGGVPASPLLVYATVRGTSDAEVVLTRIVPHIRRRGPAPEGTVLTQQCGGASAYRWLELDLDQPQAPVEPAYSEEMADANDIPPAERVPIRFPYEVSQGDAEVFEIRAVAVECDCEWWLDLHWAAGSETGVLTIDDHGEPFRTAGTNGAFADCSENGLCGPYRGPP